MVERVLYCKRNISVSVMEAGGVVVLDAVHWSSGGRWGRWAVGGGGGRKH